MTLDLSLVGHSFGPYEMGYRWQDVVRYALGIGATRDELAYVYEGAPGGLRVFPTFAVVPAYPAIGQLLERLVTDPTRLVHGAQKIRIEAPIPPEARVETTATLQGIYDLKKLAELVVVTRTTLDGRPLFETEWTLYVLGAGGQGARRPARAERDPRPPRDRPPDWTIEQPTSAEQALLYRLSGDTNPLHVDPVVARAAGFEDGPILHGLCTLGLVTRALIGQLAPADGLAVRAIAAQFRRPVWPGDVLRVAGHRLDAQRIVLGVTARGRPEPILSDCWVELAPV